MSGANYEWCPVSDAKALYVGDQDVPVGVAVVHEACRQKEAFAARAHERDRITAGVTAMRDSARALAASLPGEIAIGFAAQDEALSAVLELIGGDQP